MRSISVVLISVWFMLFGANLAGWISMPPHTMGFLMVVIGIVILLVEFFFLSSERGWFRGHS